MEALRASHAAELVRVQASVDNNSDAIVELRTEFNQLVKSVATGFADDPGPALLARIQSEAMMELRKQKSDAYRARDRAMAAVWRMTERHHELANGRCRCKLAATACRDLQAAAFFRDSFERWEKKQTQLMREGKIHGLPEDHHANRSQNTLRMWLGMPPTDPAFRRRASA